MMSKDTATRRTLQRAGAPRLGGSERVARVGAPTLIALFVRYGPKILLVLAFVLQLVLATATAYLIDLSVSLMELWADLARKHLELTL